MQHRPTRRAIAAILFMNGLCAVRPTAADGVAHTGNALVDRGIDVIAAVRAKDESALDGFARQRDPDPFDVANTMFVRSIFPKTKPEAVEVMKIEATWAAAVERQQGRCGLSELVARWAKLEEADFARERRLVLVPMKIQRAVAEEQLEQIDLVAALAEDDVVAAPWSMSAWGVVTERAAALVKAGRFGEAGEAYARAATRAEGLGSMRRVAGCWDRAAQQSFETGRWTEARERGEKSIAAYERWGGSKSMSLTRTSLAMSLLNEGRLADAKTVAEKALAEALAEGSDPHRARVLLALATIRTVLGDWADGERLFHEGLVLHAKAADRTEVMRAKFAHAQTLLESDAWALAIEAFEALDAEVTDADAVALRLLVPRSLSRLLRTLGRNADALPYARRALELATTIGDLDHLADAKSDLSLTLSVLGRHDEAAALFRAPGGSGAKVVGPELATLVREEWRGGRSDEAVVAARHAIVAFEREGMTRFASDVRRTLARILLDAGKRDEALAELAKIDTTGAADDHSYTSFLAAVAGAESWLAAGRPEDAVAEAKRALAVHRSLSRGLADEDALGTRADAAKVADLGLEAAAHWADAQPAARSRALAAAFELAEAGRALLLARGLKNPSSVRYASLSPELVAADRDSRHALEEARTHAVASTSGGSTERSAATGAGADLDAARRRRDEVLTRIGRESRRVSSFLDPAPPDLAALRALLEPRSAFVELCDAGDAIYALVVRKDDVAFRRLGGGTGVRAEIEAWLRLVSTPGTSDEKAAAAVYDAIWRPIEGDLAGVERVTITADGGLAYLPFDALVRTDGPARRRLVETLDVSYVPSASVWIALAAERGASAGDRVLAVGDPDLGALSGVFARLPGGELEAKDVAARFDSSKRALFTGAAAKADAVLATLGAEGARFRVVHFACHGTADPTSTRGTGLVLAAGQLLDGDRLARARVAADLVTLSACESGRGLLAPGEGVFGLARSFFLAGASRVVTSAWRVSDLDGRRFMADFYDAHLKGGATASAALRAAKLAAIRLGGDAAHPSRWATFTLWGLPD